MLTCIGHKCQFMFKSTGCHTFCSTESSKLKETTSAEVSLSGPTEEKKRTFKPQPQCSRNVPNISLPPPLQTPCYFALEKSEFGRRLHFKASCFSRSCPLEKAQDASSPHMRSTILKTPHQAKGKDQSRSMHCKSICRHQNPARCLDSSVLDDQPRLGLNGHGFFTFSTLVLATAFHSEAEITCCCSSIRCCKSP